MKQLLLIMILGMNMLCGNVFGGTIEFWHSTDANPTPSTFWDAGTSFSVCNSEQRSFRVRYSNSSHSSCHANRYRYTFRLFWNGGLVATAGPATLSSTFFDHTFTNITVGPGTWHVEVTFERRPCVGSWYTAEILSSSAKSVSNSCRMSNAKPSTEDESLAGTTIIQLNNDSPGQESSGLTGTVGSDISTSIRSFGEPTEQFAIYPNPANSIVTVQHPVDVETLYLHGLDGRLYRTIRTATIGKTEFDISGMPAGIYIIRANGQNPIKMIKQ